MNFLKMLMYDLCVLALNDILAFPFILFNQSLDMIQPVHQSFISLKINKILPLCNIVYIKSYYKGLS